MLVGTVALAIAALAFTVHQVMPAPKVTPSIPFSALVNDLSEGRVDSLVIIPGHEIEAWRSTGLVRIVYPTMETDAIVRRADDAGVGVSFRSPARGPSGMELVNLLLNLLFISALGYVVVRHVRGPGGDRGIGRRGKSSTTFADVAGNEGVVQELREITGFLGAPEQYARIGARTPKGILMYGAPGTGKTLMARAVAGEAGVPFYAVSGSEITGFMVGLGVMRIKSLFRKARRGGGVIFIDEIDALGGKRGRNQSHNEDDRTLNQLLVEMDGFDASDGVVVIAATNRTDDLDPALLRPGRFDRSITVTLPTALEREAILRLHVAQRHLPLGEVDLKRLARLMPRTSGAELANLVNEAAIAAGRENGTTVDWRHFEVARDRMLLGKERSGFAASTAEWRIVAYHEAGHAIAGVIGCPEDGLHKVTIQPRGQAMGVAYFSPDDDRHLQSRRYLEGQILKGLGGRAAEETVFGADAITSGARSDLSHTTRIAREMVYHLGMGPATGLVTWDTEQAPVSAETHAAMDRDVRGIVDSLYARVVTLLREHRPALDALATALLDQETVDGPEALDILRAHGVPVPELVLS